MDVAKNKKAYYDYEIIKKYEAGLVLVGNEVKSIRAKKVNLKDSFVKINYKGEVYLNNCHISPYEQAHKVSIVDARRSRKLLLKKKEINLLASEVAQQGYTLICLKMYYKGNKVKVQIALAKGKKTHDKRNALKEKAINMDVKKQLKYYK